MGTAGKAATSPDNTVQDAHHGRAKHAQCLSEPVAKATIAAFLYLADYEGEHSDADGRVKLAQLAVWADTAKASAKRGLPLGS